MDRRGMKESSKQVREWSPAPGLVRSRPRVEAGQAQFGPVPGFQITLCRFATTRRLGSS